MGLKFIYKYFNLKNFKFIYKKNYLYYKNSQLKN